MGGCTLSSCSYIYIVYLTVSLVSVLSSGAPSFSAHTASVDEDSDYANLSVLSPVSSAQHVGEHDSLHQQEQSSVVYSKLSAGTFTPSGTRPNVMGLKQLSPTPMDSVQGVSSIVAEASGQMPMMMPMPSLTSSMQKSMKGFNDFIMQMSMSMPDVGQHQSSPCAALGMSSPSSHDAFSPLAMSMSSGAADFMSMLRQLTETLNPINLLNSIVQGIKSTSMSMQASMPDTSGMIMMTGGCGSAD